MELLALCNNDIVLALFAVLASTGSTLFVSPTGDDQLNGLSPKPGRHSGPVRTIGRALVLARNLTHPVAIQVRGGDYDLPATITLGPEDSSISIAPFGGEHPILFGSRRIFGFKNSGRGWWEAEVPADSNFEQLFVGGARRFRPRLPATGYFHVAAEIQAPDPKKGEQSFKYRAGDFDPKSIDGQTEIVAFHNWHVTRDRIASADGGTLTLRNPTGFPDGWASFAKDHRYVLENVRSAFGKPGDWYLDRARHVVMITPVRGEDPRTEQVRAPILSELLHVDGAHDVAISGLELGQTRWLLDPAGRNFPQAEADMPGAIRLVNSKNCSIHNCVVTGTGAYGIEVGAGCKDATIRECVLSDLGAGGIKIGEMNRTEDPERLTERIDVEDCLIQGCGRIHPAGVGVWIGQSPNNTIRHNTIEDLYYTAISVGWSWGYGPSGSNHNLIESNRIDRVGQGVLSDMGGIYTLGLAPGTVLRGNVISNVRCDPAGYGGWGIYPDEGSSDLLIEQNLVYRCSMAGFHQHYGAHNLVRNNIFAFGGQSQWMRTRAEDHISFAMEHNIVYWDSGPLLGSNWSGSNYRLDYNDYWRSDRKPVEFEGKTLDQWKATGQDAHSVIADPGFANPARDDYRLRSNTPAIKLGFEPFDTSTAGVRVRLSCPPSPPGYPTL